MPLPGQPEDVISGFSLTNGDVLDLRAALADTDWDQDLVTLPGYLVTRGDPVGTTLLVDPTGQGAGAAVADLVGANVTLATLLSHHALLA